MEEILSFETSGIFRGKEIRKIALTVPMTSLALPFAKNPKEQQVLYETDLEEKWNFRVQNYAGKFGFSLFVFKNKNKAKGIYKSLTEANNCHILQWYGAVSGKTTGDRRQWICPDWGFIQ